MTNELTPPWRRVPMIGVNSINGSVQCFDVPDPLKTNGPPGLIISWLPFLLWEPVVLTPIQTGEANVVKPMKVLPYHGVVLFMPYRLTSTGVRKTHAALRITSVTISFERIVRRACKVSAFTAAASAIFWSIGRIVTGMISEMSRLINNFCGEFLLVVSVSVTFTFFQSLV